MNITRFEPWSFVNQLNRDFDRIGLRSVGNDKSLDTTTDWRPAVDIIDEKEQFVLRADLPGVATSDINVSMDAGVLTVSGVRPAQDNGEDSSVRRTERATGKFSRRFSLPETANAEGITARNTNGVLEISIPKLPEIQARRIAVEAA